MKPRSLVFIAKPLTLATLAAVACSSADNSTPPGDSAPSGTLVEAQGVYSYVVGVDGETGRSHLSGSHEVVTVGERGKFEKIDEPNQPGRLHPKLGDAEYKKHDPSITSGESDWDVFPSTWWAQSQNGIAKRWTGGSGDYNQHDDVDKLSPSEKYDLMFYPGQTKKVAKVSHWTAPELRKPEAERPDKHDHDEVTVIGPTTKWELENHGTYQSFSHPDSWWGHCNGWASYAIAEPGGAPKRDVRVKLDADGKLIDCDALGDPTGCVLWRMGDIEALFTEMYFSDQATFAGRRCNVDPEKIERDEYGRPKQIECRDLNAGSWHIGVTGLLSRGANHFVTNQPAKPAFVIDHNWDWEVWNFPVNKFQVLEDVEISREDAAKLVGNEAGDYVFNPDARKFRRVKMNYWMVSDGVGDSEMLKPASLRGTAPHKTELNYILELADDDTILGGEWIKAPETTWGEDNKKLHPDFYWMAVNHKGNGENADDLGGSNDNPHISYSKSKMLLACANDPASCAPPSTPDGGAGGAAGAGGSSGGPDSCVGVCGGKAESGCWCDSECTQYGDCCADKDVACGGGAGGSGGGSGAGGGSAGGSGTDLGCTAALCGTGSPGKEDGKSCYCDSSCAEYQDCCSNKVAVCGS
jgi:hypothetical protein